MKSEAYNSVTCLSKNSPSLFVKNMAVAIFGKKVLQKSSVTEIISNRNKEKDSISKPKLDPQKILAIKDILRYWMRDKYDEITIDYELTKVNKCISKKICDLNKKKIKKIAEKTIAEAVYTLTIKVNNEESDDELYISNLFEESHSGESTL